MRLQGTAGLKGGMFCPELHNRAPCSRLIFRLGQHSWAHCVNPAHTKTLLNPSYVQVRSHHTFWASLTFWEWLYCLLFQHLVLYFLHWALADLFDSPEVVTLISAWVSAAPGHLAGTNDGHPLLISPKLMHLLTTPPLWTKRSSGYLIYHGLNYIIDYHQKMKLWEW